MDCYCDREQWLVEYLERRLTDEERLDCEAHLSTCSRCRAELLALKAELDEMGLDLAAREAFARRAAAALDGAQTPVAARVARGVRALFQMQTRRAAAVASLSALVVVLVAAGALFLPRVVP